MNLLDLFVKIGIKDEASAGIEGISSNITGKLANAAAVGVAGLAAMTAAVVKVGSELWSGAAEVAEYGDNIDKMSQKMGMSAQAYQEWDSVMRHSGTSMETMKASMKTLANAAESGNEAFQRLGLSQEQVASMSQEQLFEATIAGLQGVSDTTERTYLAGQLLGRGATELGALLNTSAEETQAMRDRVHELGGVMGDDAVKQAAAFQDSMQDMQTAIQGIKNQVFGSFLPSFTAVMDGLQDVFAGNYDEGLAKVQAGIKGAADNIKQNLPTFLQRGGELVGAIANGIIEAVPTIISALGDGLALMLQDMADHSGDMIETAITFFNGISDGLFTTMPNILTSLGNLIVSLVGELILHIPEMLAAAVNLFLSLVGGLLQAAPQILTTMGETIANVVGQVLNAVGDFLDGGDSWIGGILDGIAQRIGEIATKVGDGIQKAVDKAKSFVSDMLAAGRNIIQGFIDGIGERINGIKDKISEGLANARSLLPFSPAKEGPFSGKGWTLYSGRSIMEGLAQGISEGTRSALDAAQEAVDSVSSALEMQANAEIGVSGMRPIGAGAAPQQSQIYSVYIDGAALSIDQRLAESLERFLDDASRRAEMNVG